MQAGGTAGLMEDQNSLGEREMRNEGSVTYRELIYYKDLGHKPG